MQDKYIYGIKCWEKFPEVSVSIETITPDVAIAMLERNVKNRNLNHKTNKYKGAMERGEWLLNGETIVFDNDGNLLDGQHRLDACVSSGVPFTTVVVRGIHSKAQETMDMGRKRSVSDFLKMRGVPEYREAATVGKALFKKDAYGVEYSWNSSNTYAPTAQQELDFFEKNYETRIKPIVRKSKQITDKYKGVGVSCFAAVFDEFRNVGAEDFERFYGMLMGKYAPTKTVSLLVLKLMENSLSTKKLPTEYIAAYIIKAWNCYIEGTELQYLRYQPGGARPEPFPEISHGIDNVIKERDAA